MVVNTLEDKIVGKKFGKLTVVGFEKDNHYNKIYLCNCECGGNTRAKRKDLETGKKNSCGCLNKPSEKYKYLIGQKINKWTILDIVLKNTRYEFTCQCECGTIRNVKIFDVMNGKSKDCGCGRKATLSDIRSKNLVGQRFGKLTVVEKLIEKKNGHSLYRCACDCGNEVIATSSNLSGHHVSSCGCLNSYYNMCIGTLLDELEIKYEPEYVVNIDGHYLRYDFYLSDYNLIIEYDGMQHYIPVNFGQNDIEKIEQKFRETQEYDQLKNQYCYDNNINLLRIPYWERTNIKTIICNHLQRLSMRDLSVAI